ncbi:MAG: hypothetical protein WB697_03405 [Stellaceae bacterium]
MIALCAFAATRGWRLIDFARARAADKTSEATRAWIGVPAVTTAALDAALHDIAEQGSAAAAEQRTALLTQLLAVRPMSSIAWLSLAGMRVATGEPYSTVLAALKMSSVTGPNEAEVMWERGIFGLLQWEVLPPDFQQRAIVDLAGPILTGIVNDPGRQLVRSVLSAKAPKAQAQIARMLQTQGITSVDLKQIGLSSAQTQAPAVTQ